MFYDFLRSLAPLVHPLGLLWLALIVGVILAIRRKRKKLAVAAGVLAVLLTLAGSRVPLLILGNFEAPYLRSSVADIPEADAVLMLGGCLDYSKNDLVGFNLNEAADRITTAMEMIRLKKAKVLVLSGSGSTDDDHEPTEAEALKHWMDSWNLPGAPIQTLDKSFSTREEAVKLQTLAKAEGWKRIILVTSAAHMRRAEGVVRTTTGLEIIPVACDFHRLGTPYKLSLNPIPQPNGFRYLDIYFHEKIGWFIYRWKGWITDAPPTEPAPKTPTAEKAQ